jgi:hypothetical protein
MLLLNALCFPTFAGLKPTLQHANKANIFWAEFSACKRK